MRVGAIFFGFYWCWCGARYWRFCGPNAVRCEFFFCGAGTVRSGFLKNFRFWCGAVPVFEIVGELVRYGPVTGAGAVLRFHFFGVAHRTTWFLYQLVLVRGSLVISIISEFLGSLVMLTKWRSILSLLISLLSCMNSPRKCLTCDFKPASAIFHKSQNCYAA